MDPAVVESLSKTDIGLFVIITFMALDKIGHWFLKLSHRRNGGSHDAKTIAAVLQQSNGQIHSEVKNSNRKLDALLHQGELQSVQYGNVLSALADTIREHKDEFRAFVSKQGSKKGQ